MSILDDVTDLLAEVRRVTDLSGRVSPHEVFTLWNKTLSASHEVGKLMVSKRLEKKKTGVSMEKLRIDQFKAYRDEGENVADSDKKSKNDAIPLMFEEIDADADYLRLSLIRKDLEDRCTYLDRLQSMLRTSETSPIHNVS